ncbi:hypothetical protein [Streptomyces sp. HPF1205]|uniref:hypothetical protein n=1 Tax=Streptomyces sp. HPF1205 TaxID=2873262 RepID=UPI001CECA985|nr:hypothetical protein [Streptomyces sp. HPF1205]
MRLTRFKIRPGHVLTAVGACAALTAGTVAVANNGSAAPPRPKVVVADADALLPSDTATDWVTYSDHLAVVTITSERALPPSAEETAAGEGFIPRVVTAHVDQVLWSRPGAPTAPTTMDWDLDGWTFHGDERTPLRVDGEPSMAVGERYVVPITYLSPTTTVDEAGWEPLSSDSLLPDADNTVGAGAKVYGYSGPQSDPAHTTDVKDDAWGGTPEELAATLAATPPDPNAAAYMDLPPDVRLSRANGTNHTTG